MQMFSEFVTYLKIESFFFYSTGTCHSNTDYCLWELEKKNQVILKNHSLKNYTYLKNKVYNKNVRKSQLRT